MPQVVAQIGMVIVLCAGTGLPLFGFANIAWMVCGTATGHVRGDGFIRRTDADRVRGRRRMVQRAARQLAAHTAVAATAAVSPVTSRAMVVATAHGADPQRTPNAGIAQR